MRFLILCLALGLGAPVAAQSPATLTVTGEGRVAAVPDMATVSLGVEFIAQEPLAAVDRSNEAIASILARLEEMGVEARDVQTANLSLGQVWDRSSSNGRDEVSGYRATNTVRVRVRDLDRLGEILQAVLNDGANELSGLSFGLSEPRPVEDAAREAAVKDALAKAELLASAAGVTLGPVMTITEGGGGGQPMFDAPMARMEVASPVPVSAGETVVSERVTVVFSLGE